MNCPYYHKLIFLQKYPRWSPLKISTTRISTNKNFRKNIAVFVDLTWRFNLFLLSPSETFSKKRLLWWCNLKIWTAPIIIMSWSFLNNMTDFMKSLQKLALPLLSRAETFAKIRQILWSHLKICTALYHELKLSQKWGNFHNVTWKFDLPLLSWAEFFAKTKAILMMSL